jgi:hypothetical protein
MSLHWYLSWARPIQFIPPHRISLRSISVLRTHLRLVFLVISFRLAFPAIACMHSSSTHSCYMPCSSHPPWLNRSFILGEEYKLWSSSLCSFLQSPITLSLFGQNMLLSTLFSNTLSLCFTLNVRHQVSHPYRTTGKIIVLYILKLILHTSYRQYINTILKTNWSQNGQAFGLCK